MKLAIIKIDPELAAEMFAALRDAGVELVGTAPSLAASSPHLRIVVSHETLPEICDRGGDGGSPVPFVHAWFAIEHRGPKRTTRLHRFELDEWEKPTPACALRA